ncbi:unnamed protein product [Parascedosporium putredinis]|uniref:Cytochrome P450 n=1 Tax=Parascedosporium putredinis TaxID=1442378 RepID=A0A9P1MA31_9PEZI|nr:unnamed protein product [Parascedosporium putredinis]CAI7996721.1 unnamed protein product [Parascedosporium putredinis]
MTLPIVASLVEQYETIKEQFVVMQQALAPLNLTKWQIARLLAAQLYRDTPRSLGVPKLTPSNGKHAFDYKPMLDEAARKYPDRPWFFGYSGFELVVFPSAYVNEIRRLPARTASLVDFLTTVQFGGYRLIGTDDSSNTLHKTASTDLARSIAPLGPARQETARRAPYAVGINLGDCPQWKKVSLFWTVLDVVVATGATGLVGEPLSRDKRWLNAVRLLPIGAGIGVYISCQFPRLLRPIAATISYFPALVVYKYMSYLLRPTIEQAAREYHDLPNGKDSPDKKLTLVHMLLGRYKQGEFNHDQLVKDVITATFESTPTTAVSLYWMLTELLQRPDLVEELREEITGVLKDGKLPATQLTELPKLDSFMRESARVNTFHYLGLSRILKEDVQFSIGPKLPKGTIVCVDQHHIHNSTSLYPDPEVFEPQRFLRLREKPGHETRHQYTSNSPELLTWGDGPQVCPGRVFAGNTIKILLSHLLLNYDIQYPLGTQKPPRLSFPNGSVQPDMKVQILVRERQR